MTLKNKIGLAAGALALAAAPVVTTVPAQATGCSVHVTVSQHTVQGKRTAGGCRFEVYAKFNIPGQNGVLYVGNDATTGYSTDYVPNGSYVPRTAHWRLS